MGPLMFYLKMCNSCVRSERQSACGFRNLVFLTWPAMWSPKGEVINQSRDAGGIMQKCLGGLGRFKPWFQGLGQLVKERGQTGGLPPRNVP